MKVLELRKWQWVNKLSRKGKITIDIKKAGPHLSRRFLELSMSEGPMGPTPGKNSLAAAVISVALDLHCVDERSYARGILRDAVGKRMLNKKRAIELLKTIIDFEGSLPEDKRSTTNTLKFAAKNPSTKEGESILALLGELGIDALALEELGLTQSRITIRETLRNYLSLSGKNQTDALSRLQSASIAEVSSSYAGLIADKEIAASGTMLSYTRLLSELHTPMKDVGLVKKPAHLKKTVTKEAKVASSISLEEIEQRFCLPRPGEKGDVPLVERIHVARAAAMLGLPSDTIESVMDEQRTELLNLAISMAKALPGKRTDLVDKMQRYTIPRSIGGKMGDSPKRYINHLTIMVLYYGPEKASTLLKTFKYLRETRMFLETLNNNRTVYPKAPEQLKPLSDLLLAAGIGQKTNLFEEIMKRAARSTNSIDSLIRKLTDSLDFFGDKTELIRALEGRPSVLFQSEAVLKKWWSDE